MLAANSFGVTVNNWFIRQRASAKHAGSLESMKDA